MKRDVLAIIIALVTFADICAQTEDHGYEKIDSALVTAVARKTFSGVERVYSPYDAAGTLSIIGEPDIVRHVVSMPGVSSGIEGSLGFFVRGAGSGNNKIIYNGVPIWAYSHLLGMFSSLSSDTIASASFQGGGIDVEYGDVSSSVISIQTHNTLQIKREKKLSLSPYITGLYVSGLGGDGKMGYQIAARTSLVPVMADVITGTLADNGEIDIGVGGAVYDVMIQSDYSCGNSGVLNMMFYASGDTFRLYSLETDDSDEASRRLRTKMLAAKAGWIYPVSTSMEMSVKLYYAYSEAGQSYKTKTGYLGQQSSTLGLGSARQELCGEYMMAWRPVEGLHIKTGSELCHDVFDTDSRRKQDEGYVREYNSDLLSFFLSVGYSLSRMNITGGIRYTLHNLSPIEEHAIDWRLKGDYSFANNCGVELAFDRLTQFHHVLEGLPLGWNLDVQIPSMGSFPREQTNQEYVGVYWGCNSRSGSIKASLGAYYRDMNNLVSFTTPSGVLRMNGNSWTQSLSLGKGRSYGMESFIEAQSPRIRGIMSYTLSRSDRQFDDINSGCWFPFKFDRRHVFTAQCQYTTIAQRKSSKGVSGQHLNVVLSWSSGNRATLPISTYDGILPPYWHRYGSIETPIEFEDYAYSRMEMTDVNSFKMRDYLRLDVGYTFSRARSDGRRRELTVSIFNVTNNHNPYMVYNDDGTWRQLSIMPIMPSLRWSLEW